MRTAGQMKMGYYPTPPLVATRIAQCLIRQGPGLLRTIDPSCGEGTALRTATAGLEGSLEHYGIELNRTRAAAAAQVLTRVLTADVRTTRVANASFSLVFLNPPYDFDVKTDASEASQRLEAYFLQACLRYLVPGGILTYLIPDSRLSTRIARVLSYHFDRIQVFRFPGAEYPRFRQIVVFGVRKRTPVQQEDVRWQLHAIGEGRITPPDLPERLDVPYAVPPSPAVSYLLFQNTLIDPQDLLQEIEKYGLDPILLKRFHPATRQQEFRPLMPLRRGHLALVLASGYLNNALVTHPTTGTRLLVKGTTHKTLARNETTALDGTRTITERDVLHIAISALDLSTGAFERIQ